MEHPLLKPESTHALQDPSRHTLALPHDADEQVPGANVVVTQAPCLIHCQLDHLLGSGRQPYVAGARALATSSDELHRRPHPTTLFVVDTEEVEATYVRTSALPILVSCMPVLSGSGILGWSWCPLWEPESPRLGLSELRAYQWDSLYHRMRQRPVRGNR